MLGNILTPVEPVHGMLATWRRQSGFMYRLGSRKCGVAGLRVHNLDKMEQRSSA